MDKLLLDKRLYIGLGIAVGLLIFLYGLQGVWAGVVALFLGTSASKKVKKIKDLDREDRAFRATISEKESGIIVEGKKSASDKKQELNAWLDR